MYEIEELELIRDSLDIEMISLEKTDRYKKLKNIKSKVCQDILTQEVKIKRKEKSEKPT